jgi:hypothetical protein
MKVRYRVLLVLAAPLVSVAFLEIAARLPGVRMCASINCGTNFDPGGVNIFHYQMFTAAQSVLLALGILAGISLLARGLLPPRLRWTSVGLGVLVLAFVIAMTLPSYVVGAAPSIPCSSPGDGGLVAARCDTGSPPVDERFGSRSLVVFVGLTALILGASTDRRKRKEATGGHSVWALISAP